jgi:hypothetical protein
VSCVAPGISPFEFAHLYTNDVGLCDHVPSVAVNVWPTRAVPEIVGTAKFVGMMSITELVAELVACVLEPEPFVAVTEMVRIVPTSADTGT